MKKNWYMVGLGWHTAQHIKSVGKICGWVISGGVVYGSDGGVIGYRNGKKPQDMGKKIVVTPFNPVHAVLTN